MTSPPSVPERSSTKVCPRMRRPLLMAAVGSILLALVGVLWRLDPGAYPFGPGDDYGIDASLLGATSAGAGGWLAIGAGAFGLLTAAGLAPGHGRAARFLIGAAAVQAIVLGLLVPDLQVLVLTAYFLALVLPPALLGAKIIDGLRRPRTRWWLVTALCGVLALGVAGGVLRVDTLGKFGLAVGGAVANAGARPLYLLLALSVAVCWVAVVVAYVRAVGPGRLVPASGAWIERWGTAATRVAALCPMPYALSRITWFTPWPLFPDGASEDPALRLTGILLGVVAGCCAWLTLSLIRPRGEVFPRWVPYVGGRAVPVMAAVVPGLSGAVLLTISGRSMVQQSLFDPDLGSVLRWIDPLLMPLWLWGPALAVATLAYWQRRTRKSDAHRTHTTVQARAR